MAGPSSHVTGPATPTQPQKSSTRTVAQRRVYGKRRNNAPRAVFEQKSPASASAKKQEIDNTVEAIQTKLAEVTIQEDTVPTEEDISDSTHHNVEDTKGEEDTKDSSITKITEDLTTFSSHPHEIDSPTEATALNTQPEMQRPYETMVEVRICTQKTTSSPAKKAKPEQQAQSPVSRTSRKKLPAARRSSGLIHDTKANTYVRPILDEALSPIASQNIQKFGTWASRSANMFHVAKLAEGSYGEVYKLHLREAENRPAVSKSKLAKLKAYGDGVFKVVPLRAQSGPGSKKFTTIDEIASEVKMLKYLDPIPGFARFREIHVVQGRFPPAFQQAWDYYKETKDDCLNPNPASKKSYPDSQLWAIIEMDDAGCELEKFAWSSIFQIYDIFWGVAMSLARSEEYAMFEHRDLHLGNVCIRSTKPDGCMDSPTDLEIARQSSASGFGLSSLETTIIDYSLSRANLLLGDLPDDSEGVYEVASSDLDKKQIFDAIGVDEDDALLRDTYRYMRATVYHGVPIQTEKTPDIRGIWAEYAPRTNLVWLLFILKNLLKNRKPKASNPPAQPARKALAPCSPNKSMECVPTLGKEHKAKYAGNSSALMKERQTSDLQGRVSALKQTLEDRLKAVLELLDLENGHEDMCCAADLVAYAMDSQWLAGQDFF